jgi:hypothetical protein
MTVGNYWIDQKLKLGKDYPKELVELINLFKEKEAIRLVKGRRAKNRVLRKEIDLMEGLFKKYAVSQLNIPVRYASLMPSWESRDGNHGT